MSLLTIKDLHAQAEEKEILKGVNLELNAGELHVIMGPNGSGKTTLSSVIAGHPDYEVTKGDILLRGESVLEQDPDERSKAGLFLAFQHPQEIPGVSTKTFLKTIVNEHRAAQGKDALDAFAFEEEVQQALEKTGMRSDLLDRSLNEGFSGGEKKRMEMFQLALLNPSVRIFDETDSGLDVDALKSVAEQIMQTHRDDTATLVITHYHRLLEYLKVDQVHVFVDGQIVQSGGTDLAQTLEANGYQDYVTN